MTLVAIAATFAFSVWVWARRRHAPGRRDARHFAGAVHLDGIPCQAKAAMTDREQILYQRLKKGLPPQFHLLAQVALPAIISTTDADTWNRIRGKFLDFVICDEHCRPLLVIELDDRTHDTADRQAADSDKTSALNAACIRIARTRDPNIAIEAITRLLHETPSP
jgi:very-short-patch-repair endonuclease